MKKTLFIIVMMVVSSFCVCAYAQVNDKEIKKSDPQNEPKVVNKADPEVNTKGEVRPEDLDKLKPAPKDKIRPEDLDKPKPAPKDKARPEDLDKPKPAPKDKVRPEDLDKPKPEKDKKPAPKPRKRV